MITHKREKGNEPNPQRFKMIGETKQFIEKDGISTLEYKVLCEIFYPSVTSPYGYTIGRMIILTA